jgi:hypothetical protein
LVDRFEDALGNALRPIAEAVDLLRVAARIDFDDLGANRYRRALNRGDSLSAARGWACRRSRDFLPFHDRIPGMEMLPSRAYDEGLG